MRIYPHKEDSALMLRVQALFSVWVLDVSMGEDASQVMMNTRQTSPLIITRASRLWRM